MAKLGKAHVRELLFRISVLIKGLDGVLEIVGGVVLWMVSKGLIVHVVGWLTQDEITEDPHDLVANYLRHSVRPLLGKQPALHCSVSVWSWSCESHSGSRAA